MIGKGAQYLTAAGFGRYRITAASLGSLDLFRIVDWLTGATKQAIMDAFGADGTAVIRATNEYLNGIAAIDRAKATALSAAINANQQSAVMCGFIYQYGDDFGDLWADHTEMDFNTPLYPYSGTSAEYRMWLYRTGNPKGWNTMENIISHNDWQWTKSAHARNLGYSAEVGFPIASNGSPFTIVKFFVPTVMPTGYKYVRYDAGQVYVNGTSLTTSTTETNYDFTGKIELNKPNFVAIRCNGSNNWGTAMGFKFT